MIRLFYRAAAVLLFLPLVSSIFASDPAFLRQYEQWRYAAGLSRRATPMDLPERTPGNPEYLVRVLYYVPSDRIPAEETGWQTKTDDAAARIRLIAESIEDYLAWEMENWNVATPGEEINFERNADGSIRVMPLKGRVPTKGADGHWGDDVGLNHYGIHFSVLDDIFGNSLSVRETFFENTTYLIFSDVMEMQIINNNGEFRGYLGLGSSQRSSTSGWGGYGHISAGILELWEPDPQTNEQARLDALEQSLCNDDTNITIGGVTTTVRGLAPENSAERNLMMSEMASIYMGVVAHELLHAFGLIHDLHGSDPLMHSSYPRIGAAFREMYSFDACPAVPLSGSSGGYAKLGDAFSEVLSHCPYFVDEVDPDKTDPEITISWPPSGYIDQRVTPGKRIEFRALPNDSGAGSNALLLYNEGNLMSYAVGENNISSELGFVPFWWDRYIGRRVFGFSHYDMAGNHNYTDFPMFNFYIDEYARGIIANNTLYVRRPSDEDTRPRDGTKALGSFLNPYSSIYEAIDAAELLGGHRTVIICKGTWPITEPIELYINLALTGEGVGQTILDAEDRTINIIEDNAVGTRLQNVVIANLVFKNASSGIRKTATHNQSWDLTIANNIFDNMNDYGIHHSLMWGKIAIEQNTIMNCGTGISLDGWAPFGNDSYMTVRNNTVSDCATGIYLNNLGPFRDQGQSGYNNSWGNSTNWAGNGSFNGLSYASVRLPGEISTDPKLAENTYVPSPVSGILRKGHPSTENHDGTRRDLGAIIDNEGASHGWYLY